MFLKEQHSTRLELFNPEHLRNKDSSDVPHKTVSLTET